MRACTSLLLWSRFRLGDCFLFNHKIHISIMRGQLYQRRLRDFALMTDLYLSLLFCLCLFTSGRDAHLTGEHCNEDRCKDYGWCRGGKRTIFDRHSQPVTRTVTMVDILSYRRCCCTSVTIIAAGPRHWFTPLCFKFFLLRRGR